jgi:tRNA1(Val) A37 N6-methylase TrmN6
VTPANSAVRCTDDAFLGGALQVLQPKDGYRAGIDAVLLAAAVPARAGLSEHVLDIGSGAGVVGLAVARRIGDVRVTMIERDAAQVELGRANIIRNNLLERVRIFEGDLRQPLSELGNADSQIGLFHHVAANPPFHVEGKGTVSRSTMKVAANEMPAGNLELWLRFMASMTHPNGTATMVHKADALTEVLTAFSSRFGSLVVLPIHPRTGAPANRVLVQGIKGSRAPLQVASGLALHNSDNSFRPELEAILRHGAALDLRRAAGG